MYVLNISLSVPLSLSLSLKIIVAVSPRDILNMCQLFYKILYCVILLSALLFLPRVRACVCVCVGCPSNAEN